MDSQIQSKGGAQEAWRSSLHEVLACRQFEEEDREAIERVTMLLFEYAWSNQRPAGSSSAAGPAFVNPGGDWFCDQCDKPMSESDNGYCHTNGIYYCSEECAEEHDANH